MLNHQSFLFIIGFASLIMKSEVESIRPPIEHPQPWHQRYYNGTNDITADDNLFRTPGSVNMINGWSITSRIPTKTNVTIIYKYLYHCQNKTNNVMLMQLVKHMKYYDGVMQIDGLNNILVSVAPNNNKPILFDYKSIEYIINNHGYTNSLLILENNKKRYKLKISPRYPMFMLEKHEGEFNSIFDSDKVNNNAK